ncbi:MAG TPA: alpha-(1-_3)-arabinofuranosyltransferase family protein [Candidatus Tumulicola sp.]|nr:alpha-(1->3)-arabinofuranosyltransferase family protein [Candidatus Tumulicola sp.]
MILRRITAMGAERLYAGLAVVAIFAVAFHWWRPGYTISGGDSVYPPDPFHQLLVSFSAWNHSPSILGSASGGSASAPFLLVLGVLRLMFGSSLAQIIALSLLQTGAWLGMQAFLRQLRASAGAAAIGATFYVFNQWSIQFFGFNYALEILMILLPIAGVLALRFNPPRARVLSFCFVLLVAIPCAPLGVNPALILLALFGFASLAGLAFLLSLHRREFTRWMLGTLGLSLVAAAWWLLPICWQYLDSLHTFVLSPSAWSWVIARSSILNNLRWTPMWQWRSGYTPYAPVVDGSPLLYAAEFASIAALCLALAFSTGEQRRILRYSALMVAAAIIISKGLHPPATWFNELLYKVPGMFLFREPTSKAPLIGLIFASVGLALCYDVVAARIRRAAGRLVLATALIVPLILSAYPAVTRDRDATDDIRSHYTRVPGYWLDAIDYLNAQPDFAGILMLPPVSYYQVNYGWFYGSDGITTALLNKPIDRLVSQDLYSISPQRLALNSRIRTALFSGSPLLGRMLGDMGIGYVLYRGDVVGDPRDLVSRDALRSELGRAEERRFGPLAVFTFPHRPRVNMSARWIEQTGRSLEAGDELELRALEETLPRLSASASTPLWSPALVESIDDSASSDRLVSVHNSVTGRLTGTRTRLAASFLGSDFARREVVVSRLKPLAWSHAIGCVAVFQALHDLDADVRSYRVFNASFYPIKTTLAILVRPQADRVYALRYGDGRASRALAASRFPVWLEFQSVRIQPGETSLVLGSEPGRGGERLPAYEGGENLGAVHVACPQFFVRLPRPDTGSIAFDPKHPLVSLGGIPLALTLADEPWVSISAREDPNARVNYGVVWLVEVRSKRYTVYQRTNVSVTPASTVDAIEATLAQAGVKVTANDFAAIRVLGVQVVASAWEWQPKGTIAFSNVRIGWTDRGAASARGGGLKLIARVDGRRIEADDAAGSVVQSVVQGSISGDVAASIERVARSLSVAALGRVLVRESLDAPVASVEQEGLLVVHVPADGPRLITLTDQYDPAWTGIAWRGLRPSLLPHMSADRWRNAFIAPPGSAVMLFFLGVPLQYVSLLAAAALIAALGLRLRRRP